MDIYGISFTNDIQPAPGSISLTSLKCIITAEDGTRYFLKQKAEYCSTEQQLRKSSLLQHTTATQLQCVPRIIHTASSDPHAAIGRRAFLLTPFVEGQFFLGKRSQSVSCGDALGRIHSIGMHMDNIEPTVLNSHHETKEWISRLAQIATTDDAAKQEVIRQMRDIADCNEIQNIGRKGWLHGDFAPYNMVFDHSDSVIAVNDFDNVAYGPLSRDVAECILTHCGVMYAGPSSSLRAPICTRLDVERGKMMLERYLQSSGLQPSDLCELRQQFSLIWLELLSLGMALEWDWSDSWHGLSVSIT